MKEKIADKRRGEMKRQLERMRKQGKKFVLWSLTPTQKQDLEKLGYKIMPHSYQIETRQFYNIRNLHSALLKDIHYAKKRYNKKYLIRQLNPNERKLLDDYGVKYTIIKHKIYL